MVLGKTILGAAAAGAAVTGLAVYQTRRYGLTTHILPILPQHAEPLRLLHLSDLHATVRQQSKLQWLAQLSHAVEPDVTVFKDEEEWKIVLNSDYIPRLRISNTYREMIAKGTLSKAERD